MQKTQLKKVGLQLHNCDYSDQFIFLVIWLILVNDEFKKVVKNTHHNLSDVLTLLV